MDRPPAWRAIKRTAPRTALVNRSTLLRVQTRSPVGRAMWHLRERVAKIPACAGHRAPRHARIRANCAQRNRISAAFACAGRRAPRNCLRIQYGHCHQSVIRLPLPELFPSEPSVHTDYLLPVTLPEIFSRSCSSPFSRSHMPRPVWWHRLVPAILFRRRSFVEIRSGRVLPVYARHEALLRQLRRPKRLAQCYTAGTGRRVRYGTPRRCCAPCPPPACPHDGIRDFERKGLTRPRCLQQE